MKQFLFILSCLFITNIYAQTRLSGVVVDAAGEAIFAANVYCKNAPTEGTTTDFDGKFTLATSDLQDTLLISFIGYQTLERPLSTIAKKEAIQVQLNTNALSLSEITVKATNPISEQFAVTQLTRLDIYMNPVAQADPLKAITALPASTTANETANPSLRGSAPDRTRVVLNGVPIYKPVRASQLNNQGFFSLFNPEIIERQYVYASNPPLTYGNTSAGLVEINTTQQLEQNRLNISATLASTGVFWSQNLGKDAFVQAYGNVQFSEAFTGIQEAALPQINNFRTKDAGVNFHYRINDKTTFNSFAYGIDEHSDIAAEIFAYTDNFESTNKRVFTVSNLTHLTEKGAFYFRNGTNYAKESATFGNLDSRSTTNETYTSIDYKHFLNDAVNVQIGASHNYRDYDFKDSIPSFYYAWSSDAPNFYNSNQLTQHDIQAYAYAHWDLNKAWSLSSGIRSNIPVQAQASFWSMQAGLRFQPNPRHHVLLSGGQYHNYSTPNFFAQRFELLQSQQVALDYAYQRGRTSLKAAIYYKHETGNRLLSDFTSADRVNTFGLEAFWEQDLQKYIRFSISNAFVQQDQFIQDEAYRGELDFSYFLKAALSFNHPKLFSASLMYTSRPGISYTPIVASQASPLVGIYEPIFGNLYSDIYNNYHRIDISVSRYIPMKRSALIPFASVTNLLNRQNEREALHNADYSKLGFDYYQLRTFFFGLVWEFRY